MKKNILILLLVVLCSICILCLVYLYYIMNFNRFIVINNTNSSKNITLSVGEHIIFSSNIKAMSSYSFNPKRYPEGKLDIKINEKDYDGLGYITFPFNCVFIANEDETTSAIFTNEI